MRLGKHRARQCWTKCTLSKLLHPIAYTYVRDVGMYSVPKNYINLVTGYNDIINISYTTYCSENSTKSVYIWMYTCPNHYQ